ncbi:hypothetical protein [Priestia aryabhattai]|uniref:hypothetical protein n=1 Tax=Priestia aryabhattai TaxID=412384 RepID=UPI0008DC79EF|nr:hypothetical protein [Priestia aryabhattai]OHY73337.1 hypothetical protein BCV52_26870 [Priestia aryabhattai]
MEMGKILKSIHSQLKISQKCPVYHKQRNQINTGELISFYISPWLSHNAGFVEKGDIDVNAMSHITGKVPVVQGIPLSIEVEWIVKRADGSFAVEGVDYLAPNGLTNIDMSIVFIPTSFIELSSSPTMVRHNTPKEYSLHAKVKIMAGEEKTEGELLPIILPVLPMAIPTIFTAFSNQHFLQSQIMDSDYSSEEDGRTLIMVPFDSPFRSKEDLLKIVNELKDRVATLSQLSDFFLLGLGLNMLYNALTSYHHDDVCFRVESSFDLNCVHCGGQAWAGKTNSFILIGMPGYSVRCYNKHEKPDEGTFVLQIAEDNSTCYALARKLDSKKPETEPYNNELDVEHTPKETFAQKIEWIDFRKAPITPVNRRTKL